MRVVVLDAGAFFNTDTCRFRLRVDLAFGVGLDDSDSELEADSFLVDR